MFSVFRCCTVAIPGHFFPILTSWKLGCVLQLMVPRGLTGNSDDENNSDLTIDAILRSNKIWYIF